MSTEQQNLSLAKRFVQQGLGHADLTVFNELLDPDVRVTTGLSPTGPILGRDNYRTVFAAFAQAWPVRELTVEDAFASGDKVVVRFTAVTVFAQDYYGVKATRQVVPLREVHVLTFRDGKIVENVVGAINFPFEYTMYPALKDLVLGPLEPA